MSNMRNCNKIIASILLIIIGLASPDTIWTQIAEQARKTPSLEVMPIAYFKPKMHTGLGWFPTRLGDLDGDGYDDFAIASYLDTTFIYYGGDTIATEPRYKFPGGSGGIAAGDFNGDGYIDIASTFSWLYDTTASLGRVFVYYNTKTDPPYHDSPDQIIQGRHANEKLGWWLGDYSWPGIVSGNVNNDGKADLIMTDTEDDSSHTPPRHMSIAIFLGDERLHDTPDIYLSPQKYGNGQSHT